jgi:outer membrane protein TolC
MKFLKSILLVTLLTLFCQNNNGVAQEINLNSVDDAIEYALDHNPSLEVYKIQAEVTEINYRTQRNSRFPTISYSFTGQRTGDLAVTPLPGELFGQPGETVDAEFGQPYSFNSGLTVQSNKLDWQNRLQTKLAKNEISVIEAEIEEFKQQLAQQVSLYYYSALIAERAIQLSDSNSTISNEIVRLTELKFNQGIEDQFSLNQTKIQANNSSISSLSNQAFYDECIHQLKILLGLRYVSDLELSEELDYNWNEDIDYSQLKIDSRLVTLSNQIQSSELNLKIQRASFLPSVSLTKYNGKQLNRDDFDLGFITDDWTDYSYLSVGVSIPIFSGFNRSNNVKIANRELSLARLNYQTELQNRESSDMLLISDFNLSVETLDQSYGTFKLAQENQEIAYSRYENGLINLDQYLLAVDDRIGAENAYLNDLTSVYSNYSTIISRTILK